MLDFFRKLRREGRLVFLCIHPNERFHLEILEEICERFIFVQNGRLTQIASFDELINFDSASSYLGDLLKEDAA
jgi:ABC-type multidrug transport system ATPase subunit